MAPRGQPLSITLPRNFTFHYTDALPKTPEPLSPITTPIEPPPPPKVRIRRRRQVVISGEHTDYNLPTIEFSDNDAGILPDLKPELKNGFLSPFPKSGLDRMFAPPITPVGQGPNPFDPVVESIAADVDEIQLKNGESIVRPSSAWSEISDSSTDSDASEGSLPLFGEDCTSPESVETDPFVFPNVREKMNRLSSPLALHHSQPRRSEKLKPKARWTSDMDDHLWLTYMTYLSDPTVTPFKMLPGTAPPLGVCHRVAREAKKNWKGPRSALDAVEQDSMRLSPIIPSYVPNFSRPILRTYSTSEITRKASTRWTRSASATRRRLRELCKRRPCLAPHYQRLMQSRTPSPFEPMGSEEQSQTSRFTSPPPPPPPTSTVTDDSSVFSTRELNLTLATSTSSSMQHGGSLSQLNMDEKTVRRRPWSHQPTARVSAHQKSQSLQLELGLGNRPKSYDFRRLASPFTAATLPPSWMQYAPSPIAEELSIRQGPAPPPQPEFSTPRIHAPRPLSASMKRRAHYPLGEEAISKDVDARRSWLEGLFHDSAKDENDAQRRVRSRGFSMGAVKYAPAPRHARHLSEIFAPPSRMDIDGESSSSAMPPVPPLPQNIDRLPVPQQQTLRLGSPFAPHLANVRYSNTFPRNAFPQGLDGLSPFDDLSKEPPSDGSSSTIRY